MDNTIVYLNTQRQLSIIYQYSQQRNFTPENKQPCHVKQTSLHQSFSFNFYAFLGIYTKFKYFPSEKNDPFSPLHLLHLYDMVYLDNGSILQVEMQLQVYNKKFAEEIKKVNLDQKLGKRINCVGFKRGLILLQQHKRKDLQNNQYEGQNEHRMFISSSATHSSSKLHCCTWIKF